jgi:hypothetical protein
MFGWSGQDVVTLIQICDRFIKAYGDGPEGASTDLKVFKQQVELCRTILNFIQEKLQKPEREFFELFELFLKPDSLMDTLDQCDKISNENELLKEKGEQKMRSKVTATVKYLWSDGSQVQKLSENLKRHVS